MNDEHERCPILQKFPTMSGVCQYSFSFSCAFPHFFIEEKHQEEFSINYLLLV